MKAGIEGVAEGVGWNLGVGSWCRIGHCTLELQN